MRNVLAPLVFAALIAIGCGAANPAPGSSPDGVVSNTPGSDAASPGGAQRVEPRDGLVDIRATSFDRFRSRAQGRAVDLFFWSGIEECYGVDRVDVRYATKTVTVTIYEGRDPGAETCIELAVRKVVQVELDEPLGNRTVVDGNSQG